MRKLKWIGVIISLMTVMLMGSLLAAPAFAAPAVPKKIDICHKTSDGEFKLISVGSRSFDAHVGDRGHSGDFVLTIESPCPPGVRKAKHESK